LRPDWRRILCIANGDLGQLEWAKEIASHFDAVVAVDGGLNHCERLHIQPNLIIGDLDSITPQQLSRYSNVELITAPWEKDQTDLELALQAIDPASRDEVALLGGLGLRTDHLLGNLTLLTRYPGKVRMLGPSETLWVINQREEIDVLVGQELSLIPMNGPASGITTRGLKWELTHATLDKWFIGISNVCLKERISIEVESGDLLFVLQQNRILVPAL
jgi:thiamine pyrophosphokinase